MSPPPHLFRYLHSHGHCPVLPSEDTCTRMPTSCPGFCGHLYSHACFHHLVSAGTNSLKATAPLRPVQTFALTCPRPGLSPAGSLPLSLSPLASASTSTHSYACCLSLFFRGTCPPMPTAPLWRLQASALTCPPPFSAFYCHLHFYAHCSPLVFPGTCIHIPSASL